MKVGHYHVLNMSEGIEQKLKEIRAIYNELVKMGDTGQGGNEATLVQDKTDVNTLGQLDISNDQFGSMSRMRQQDVEEKLGRRKLQ